MNAFAKAIYEQKYAHDIDGRKETWEETANRVGRTVLKAVHASKDLQDDAVEIIRTKKFIPGGRYLASTGKQFHQTQNCLLLRAQDSREGWSDLYQKASMALMTGAGIGVDYSHVRGEGKPIRKTGGRATGPLALCESLNRVGCAIRQGGDRRSAIWAGLSWQHPDIHKFITFKNWSPEVRALKEKDFDFPATMDGTNISVQLDDEFFAAFGDEKHAKHSLAHSVYWATVRQMLKTGEPGFSVDLGKNSKETLRNACVPAGTEILTRKGYKAIETLLGQTVEVWNGSEWSKVKPKVTGKNERVVKVLLSSGQSLICTRNHKFIVALDYFGTTKRIDAAELQSEMKLVKANYPIIAGGEPNEDAYKQGFISAEGMDDYNFFMVYEPKYMCLKRLDVVAAKAVNGRVTVRVNFAKRPKSFVPFEWDVQSRLNWLAGLLDGDGTLLKEGGTQISSVNLSFLLNCQKLLTTLGVGSKVTAAQEAGMRSLPDGRGGIQDYYCQDLYRLLIGATEMQDLHGLGLRCERMDFSKFKPNRNAGRFAQVISVEDFGIADTVYCFNEPKKHSAIFEGILTGQCTEVTSADDSDICNLGSINLAQITSVAEFESVMNSAITFLLAGTVYSDVPYAKVDQIRTKNRRLGLGLMGIHEWLLVRGKRYGQDAELEEILKIYAQSTKAAREWADKWDLSHPVKTRAIAPTGTIGIIAETSTGIESLFCVAYKRRYAKGNLWAYQYVVDPTAKRLIDSGINPDLIEDAYTLAEDPERRVAFQAWTQQFVDHGISSTINLPAWGSEANNESKVQPFGEMLIRYLPKLRGITCYPDGGRSGQPLQPIKYATAIKHVGEVFEEAVDVCDLTKGGSCGA